MSPAEEKSKLCYLCSRIDIVSLIGGLEAYTTRSIKHHPNYLALSRAADTGCELCTLFRATLTIGSRRSSSVGYASPTPPPLLHRTSTGISTSSDQSNGKSSQYEAAISWHEELDKISPPTPGSGMRTSASGYTLEVKARSTLDTDFEVQYIVQVSRTLLFPSFNGELSMDEEIVRSSALLLSNDYDLGLGIRDREIGRFPSFTTYSSWIRGCAHGGKHSRCATAEPVELPSRVIDVGGGSGSEIPKLIETTPGMKDYYVTLSHCWGKTRPLTTTLANLETHKAGLPFKRFPKQFQDAALITRIMGYRYLWIDSLCIIQDSTSDWEVQCLRMGDIYRRSICTLAAPIAAGSEEGLLRSRPLPRIPSCKLRAIRSHELVGYISVGIPAADFREKGSGSRLASRAWVLQEQLMSPRTLYFAEKGMYFQCNSHELIESYHHPLPPERLTSWRTSEASDMPKTIIAMTTHDDVSYWYAVVRQYCFRQLTFGGDKLPALSGLAKVVSESATDEGEEEQHPYSSPLARAASTTSSSTSPSSSAFGTYLAGLWSSDLSRGLMWFAADERSDKLPSLHERDPSAPTWSWASQNRPVDWKVLKELKPKLEYVSSKMEYVGSNQFGRVKRGLIRVKGASVKAVMRRSKGTSRSVLLCTGEYDPREAAEIFLDGTAREWLEQRWTGSSRQVFHCRVLRLGHAENSLNGRRWYGLLLCDTGEGKGEYRRLGAVTSLGVGIAHARSLSVVQSYNWLGAAPEEVISIV